jgi:hypothetical protein
MKRGADGMGDLHDIKEGNGLDIGGCESGLVAIAVEMIAADVAIVIHVAAGIGTVVAC